MNKRAKGYQKSLALFNFFLMAYQVTDTIFAMEESKPIMGC